MLNKETNSSTSWMAWGWYDHFRVNHSFKRNVPLTIIVQFKTAQLSEFVPNVLMCEFCESVLNWNWISVCIKATTDCSNVHFQQDTDSYAHILTAKYWGIPLAPPKVTENAIALLSVSLAYTFVIVSASCFSHFRVWRGLAHLTRSNHTLSKIIHTWTSMAPWPDPPTPLAAL